MSNTRPVTFSPEALAQIVAAVNAARKTIDKKHVGKPAKKTPATDGKTAKQIANEKATIRAFKKAGFGTVVPHEDVKTFGRWMAIGMRPLEGSKSVKAGSMRLFHKTQVRPLTEGEKAEATVKPEPSNVTQITDRQ